VVNSFREPLEANPHARLEDRDTSLRVQSAAVDSLRAAFLVAAGSLVLQPFPNGVPDDFGHGPADPVRDGFELIMFVRLQSDAELPACRSNRHRLFHS